MSPALSPGNLIAPPEIHSNKKTVEITNIALSDWWMKISNGNKTVVTWEILYQAISDYLELSNQGDLNTERIRKKIDFKSNLVNPTLSRLYQIIQEKPPHEFFIRFLNTEPDSMSPQYQGQNKHTDPSKPSMVVKKESLITIPMQKKESTPPQPQKKHSVSSIPLSMLKNDSLISIPIPQKKESIVANPTQTQSKAGSNPTIIFPKKNSISSVPRKPEPLHVTTTHHDNSLPVILSAQTSPAEEHHHDPLQVTDAARSLYQQKTDPPPPKPSKPDLKKPVIMEKTPAKKGSCCIIL